jgi:hypothetical protein
MAMRGLVEMMAGYKPRRGASEESRPADIMTCNFQSPESNGLLLKAPTLWYFITAVNTFVVPRWTFLKIMFSG